MFLGRVPVVHAARQAALDGAYALHPERFPNGPPKAALPPAEVHINPLEARALLVDSEPLAARDTGTSLSPAPAPTTLTENAPHGAARTPRREALAAAAMAFAT